MLPLHGDLGSHSGEQAAAKDHTGARANHDRKAVTRCVLVWHPGCTESTGREPGTG